MIAIVDYGIGNFGSVEKALAKVGGDPVLTGDPDVIRRADKVVLPGVGAFCATMTNLNESGLREPTLEAIRQGKPFLGICVGMQMLFDASSEMGATDGIGVFPGQVVKFFEDELPAGAEELKVPHIGWNSLQFPRPTQLFRGIEPGSRVYFVHSYYPKPANPSVTAATSDYGVEFCCAVERGNVAATQFHPEKSGAVGLQILRNFVEWKE